MHIGFLYRDVVMGRQFAFPWKIQCREIWVCSSKRLVRALQDDIAVSAGEQGEAAWMDVHVMTWSGLVRSWLDRYLAGGGVKRVLNAQQSLVLWKSVIEASLPFGEYGFADLAKSSWSTLHQWGLDKPWDWDPTALSDDQLKFVEWAQEYAKRCEENGWVDEDVWLGVLPEAIGSGLVGSGLRFVFKGFDLGLSPAQKAIVDALAAAGCSVDIDSAATGVDRFDVIGCESPDEEIEAAAMWARRRAESGQSVGVVVTGLEERIEEVDRVFWREMAPGQPLHDPDWVAPWHISLGSPLSRVALIDQALAVLGLGDRVSTNRLGAMLRSPFFDGWPDECGLRAAFDRDVVRKLPGSEIEVSQVFQLFSSNGVPQCGIFEDCLTQWWGQRREGSWARTPESWAGQFLSELDAIGFGRGRDLTSKEYQAWHAFVEVLEPFSSLGEVVGIITRTQAVEMLLFFLNGRLFREQDPGAPIEILSPREALGGQFDAVWVTGLDDANWPAAADPDPLIPLDIQMAVPSSTPEGSVELAEVTLARLAVTCGHGELDTGVRVASFAHVRDDLPMRLSGLVPHGSMPPEKILGSGWRRYPEEAPVVSVGDDAQGPAHPAGYVRGGSKVLHDQSACPFRSFAVHRLGARALESPGASLSRMARGNVVHDVLEVFWDEMGSLQNLLAVPEAEWRGRVRRLVEDALERARATNPLSLEAASFELEVERVTGRVIELIEVDRDRPDFVVESVERSEKVAIGALEFRLKIDRVDRVDGGTLLVDYKTGNTKITDWVVDTGLADPQMPIYLAVAEETPIGLAFGKVRPGEVGYQGVSCLDVGVAGIAPMDKAARGAFKPYSSWSSLVSAWKQAVWQLAEDFHLGRAGVLPRDRNVCDFCHLKSLCRVEERRAL